MTDEILTIREVAELLNNNEKTANNPTSADKIAGFKTRRDRAAGRRAAQIPFRRRQVEVGAPLAHELAPNGKQLRVVK